MESVEILVKFDFVNETIEKKCHVVTSNMCLNHLNYSYIVNGVQRIHFFIISLQSARAFWFFFSSILLLQSYSICLKKNMTISAIVMFIFPTVNSTVNFHLLSLTYTKFRSCAPKFCFHWFWEDGDVLCLNLPRYQSCITVACFVPGVLSVGERMKRSQRHPPISFP